MLEKQIEQYLTRRAKEEGFLSYKFSSPGNRGVPDRILVGNGSVYFVECKAPTGKLSPMQQRTIDKFERMQQPVFVVYSKEQVDQLLERIKND